MVLRKFNIKKELNYNKRINFLKIHSKEWIFFIYKKDEKDRL